MANSPGSWAGQTRDPDAGVDIACTRAPRLLETDQRVTSLQLEYERPELTLPEREALTDLLVALLDGHVV
jgi:hypothetical protein